MSKKTLTTFLITTILLLTAGTVASNYAEQLAIDNSKISEGVELSSEFQKWITNLKKRVDVSADEFRLLERNEVFNSAYLTIASTNDSSANTAHQAKLAEFKGYPNVRFSPNGFQFLDYRHQVRTDGNLEYQPNEIYYHGLQEDKIIDTRILKCDDEYNCYFDRGFFVDNHIFVISEFSRPELEPACSFDEICTYTIKLHVFDLINSTRLVYESEPYELNLAEMTQYF